MYILASLEFDVSGRRLDVAQHPDIQDTISKYTS